MAVTSALTSDILQLLTSQSSNINALWNWAHRKGQAVSVSIQSKKKSAVTALTMVIDFAPIPIISQ
jgi:hypothetical protein